MEKNEVRLRRARRGRMQIRALGVVRLSVHRTPKHIYAQIISSGDNKVLACASTLDKDLRTQLTYGGNVDAASKVGELIAKRAQEVGVKKVAFDRSGFKYHGRVKALAEAARSSGLEF